jgi:hypothetical protein
VACWSGKTYFAPVVATVRTPPSFLAVTSQAIREQAKPRTGVKVAAAQLCLLHISVKLAGSTAEEIMTPMSK